MPAPRKASLVGRVGTGDALHLGTGVVERDSTIDDSARFVRKVAQYGARVGEEALMAV
jgi:hypothetical protein